MINKDDKIIVIESGDAGKAALIERLKEQAHNVILVDDINSAKDLITGEYSKEVVNVIERTPMLHQNPWAGDMTKKQINAPEMEPVRSTPKIQNNELCPCGSGKKYKKCCK